MLPVAEAQAKLLALVRPLPAERVSIEEAAGRVLAEDIDAATAVPPFSSSTMDGYAVNAAQVAALPLPLTLPIEGASRAGGEPGVLAPGCAARIFTGARLPVGADSVVPQEKVVVHDGRAQLTTHPHAGASVRCAGDDLARGARAVERGTLLHAGHVGLLAMLDRAWLDVTRRPVVTVLSTGDEIRAPGQVGNPGSVPDASGVAIRALLRGAGAVVRAAGTVRDDAAATESALRAALRGCDVLVTIGGVSVGDHDLVRPALARLGVQLDFWRVAMKPGKPLAIGQLGDTLVVGLPGNPSSAVVAFVLFGLPLLRALGGRRDPLPRPSRIRLAAPVAHELGRLELARATFGITDGVPTATVLANQASAALTSLAAADGLVALPGDTASFAAGSELDAYRWAELVS